MNNINKPRFLLSVFLLSLITGLVYFNQPGSAALFAQTQLLLSEYLGWFIILVANGFLIFTIYKINVALSIKDFILSSI